jgi:glycosyltransferase involved in cell wall biosynthesis
MTAKNPAFPGRLGLQQRVLPAYRAPFFDLLAGACKGGMSVFAGQPRPEESIPAGRLRVGQHVQAQNIHLLGGGLYFCYQRGLTHWLADWDPEILVAEANPRYLATSAAVRWMHDRGRKAVAWGLGAPGLPGPLAAFNQKQRARFLGQFDAWIAYSRRGAEQYAALGLPRENIFVAPNAVAARPDQPAPQRPLKKDRASLLFVGRLQARKRVDRLLYACAELPEPKPDLVIVGEGPERQHLESLARKIYPTTNFAGAIQGAALDPYFEAADLFVLPGTGGLAVQEAMAHGLPVIVAQGDGTQDELVRAGNGWQVTPDDQAALVEALRSGVSEIERLRKMGKESLRIVSDEINLEKMVETFVLVLNSLK